MICGRALVPTSCSSCRRHWWIKPLPKERCDHYLPPFWFSALVYVLCSASQGGVARVFSEGSYSHPLLQYSVKVLCRFCQLRPQEDWLPITGVSSQPVACHLLLRNSCVLSCWLEKLVPPLFSLLLKKECCPPCLHNMYSKENLENTKKHEGNTIHNSTTQMSTLLMSQNTHTYGYMCTCILIYINEEVLYCAFWVLKFSSMLYSSSHIIWVKIYFTTF